MDFKYKTTPSLPENIKAKKIDWLIYLIILTTAISLAIFGASQMGYQWEWAKVGSLVITIKDGKLKLGPFFQSLKITLFITIISFILTIFFALITALARLFASTTLKGLGRLYLETIRNTPLLIQLFCLYFILGPLLGLPRIWSAILALSLFEGAYLSEIIRSGILAVPEEQWQASWCLGLSTRQTLSKIILPQAGRIILPATCNQAISLLKDSALVSTVALYDLTQMARESVAESWLTFETWFLVAIVYLSLALIISYYANTLEKKLNTHK